eukprot:3258243-Amphidinium_carterae.1
MCTPKAVSCKRHKMCSDDRCLGTVRACAHCIFTCEYPRATKDDCSSISGSKNSCASQIEFCCLSTSLRNMHHDKSCSHGSKTCCVRNGTQWLMHCRYAYGSRGDVSSTATVGECAATTAATPGSNLTNLDCGDQGDSRFDEQDFFPDLLTSRNKRTKNILKLGKPVSFNGEENQYADWILKLMPWLGSRILTRSLKWWQKGIRLCFV